MGQISSNLRSLHGGAFAHWCPACETVHVLPGVGWTFDGNLERPSFSPSFRHQGGMRGSAWVCHYHLRAGVLEFCTDSSHALKGQSVTLPPLPAGLRDEY